MAKFIHICYLFWSIKFYWNSAIPIPLHISCDFFYPLIAELSHFVTEETIYGPQGLKCLYVSLGIKHPKLWSLFTNSHILVTLAYFCINKCSWMLEVLFCLLICPWDGYYKLYMEQFLAILQQYGWIVKLIIAEPFEKSGQQCANAKFITGANKKNLMIP